MVYPSRAFPVRRNILFRLSREGGIVFPDIELRKQVNRLIFYIRILTHKEALSWRKAFDHFYIKIQYLPKRQIKNFQIDDIFKEIRRAVIDTSFRRDGDFCWIFNKRYHMKSLTPKRLYDDWIRVKYGSESEKFNRIWVNDLGFSKEYIQKSWEWSKTKFDDGVVRDTHFKIRHKALFTNHRTQYFTEGTDKCSYCESLGIDVREDNPHIAMYCVRTFEAIADIVPLLKDISKREFLSAGDLVLVLKLHNKYDQTCFNWVLQNFQYAVWKSRCRHNFDGEITSVHGILIKNIFRSLCRLKIYLPEDIFYAYFAYIAVPNRSVIGFGLKDCFRVRN